MYFISPAIDAFYTKGAESSRLTTGLGPLEFERNKDLISRYLPPATARIADVGGGPGHYAQWLAHKGHQVTLIDPVAKHIQQAKQRAQRSKRAYKCLLGDARQLPLDNQSVDIVILHGPLYHILDRNERVTAIKEARRVLKTGGVVLGFAITYAASTLAALQQGLIYHPDIFNMCKEEILSNCHFAPDSFPGVLPEAYFHRPSDLVMEFKEAGFRPTDTLAVEGIAWLANNFFEGWANPEKKKQLLELVKLTERDQDLLCLSPHIMLAGECDLW